MTLGAPQMLWLLPLLGLPLVGFFWWAWRRRQELITQFISARLINQLKVGVSTARQKLRMALMVVVVALLVFALARPQWGTTEEEARQRGLDIVVAVDTSNSMLAQDVSPNRLARAKLAALDLVHRAKTDRMGLIAFAGTAFLECPLTLDDAAFSQSVDSLDTQTISQAGTAIAEAINEARKAFKQESDNHKVLVLFTDGEDHDSDAVPAAQKAAEDGMIIFTVGIGTPEGELLRIRDEQGRTDYLRDEQGQPVKSHLNEELLQQIAAAAKGFYLPLRAKTIDQLYDNGIAPLPKTENSTRFFQRYRERFYWPLAAAMLLLVLEMFLPDRKRRKRPAAAATAPSPAGALTETAAILLLLAIPVATQAGGASQAFRDYNQGKFDEAFKNYNQLLEQKKDDPRLNFNAGAAAYQDKKLDEAVKQFNEALKSPDLNLQQRAYYNLANTFYRMGEQNQDTAKKQEAWENALKQYTNALALNKQDPDAGFNRDFVQQQLEELKKQQSQSQSQDDKQKQDQKQDQKNQDGSKQDQQNSQSKQNQDQSSKDQGSQAQNQPKPDQDKQKNDQSQAQNQQDKQDQEKKDAAQKQAANQPKDKPTEEQQREAAMMAAGEMTPQQAAQLLDAQKDDEQALRLAPPNKNVSQPRSYKNW